MYIASLYKIKSNGPPCFWRHPVYTVFSYATPRARETRRWSVVCRCWSIWFHIDLLSRFFLVYWSPDTGRPKPRLCPTETVSFAHAPKCICIFLWPLAPRAHIYLRHLVLPGGRTTRAHDRSIINKGRYCDENEFPCFIAAVHSFCWWSGGGGTAEKGSDGSGSPPSVWRMLLVWPPWCRRTVWVTMNAANGWDVSAAGLKVGGKERERDEMILAYHRSITLSSRHLSFFYELILIYEGEWVSE